MSPIPRRTVVFAAIFFAVNLAFDAYRAGGLTVGAFASAAVVTCIATAIYFAVISFIARKKDTG